MLILSNQPNKTTMRKILMTCLLTVFSFETLQHQEAVATTQNEVTIEYDVEEDLVTWDSVEQLIKKGEGLALEPYICPGGYLTIGYGHLMTDKDSALLAGIDKQQADSLLKADLKICKNWVQRNLNLSGNQLRAMTKFCFAFGTSKLGRSTLAKKIRKGEKIDQEMLRWTNLNGRSSKRLREARLQELALYNSGKKRITLNTGSSTF